MDELEDLQREKEEDKRLITYIKENANWKTPDNFDNIFENYRKLISDKRPVSAIKSRFLNKIIPNLEKYDILNCLEIVSFYDKAGLEVPPEKMQILLKLKPKGNKNSTENSFSLTNQLEKNENGKINYKSLRITNYCDNILNKIIKIGNNKNKEVRIDLTNQNIQPVKNDVKSTITEKNSSQINLPSIRKRKSKFFIENEETKRRYIDQFLCFINVENKNISNADIGEEKNEDSTRKCTNESTQGSCGINRCVDTLQIKEKFKKNILLSKKTRQYLEEKNMKTIYVLKRI